MTALTLKMNKIGVFGANKRRKTLAGYDIGKKFLKEKFWGYILSG